MLISTNTIRVRFSSLFLIACSFLLVPAYGQAPSNIQIANLSNVYAGDMVYMGLVVNEPEGTPYSIESVTLGNIPLEHELHCRILMCGKDKEGKYGTTVYDEVTLGSKVPAIAPGSYTFTLTMKVNGAVKVETRTLNVWPQPAPPPPPPALTGPPVPGIEKWESTMLSLGAKWCPGPNEMAFGDYSQVWYYDGARVYFQMADYTGDKRWETCAFNIARQYRDLAISRDGNVLGWAMFPHGLRMAYERTGDPSYKQAIDLISTKSGWAYWLLGADDVAIREISYIVNMHVEAERLGAPRHPNLARRIDYLLGHFDRLFKSNSYTIHQTAYDAVAVEALIYYYELTKDPRVPPAVKSMLDWTWDYGWNKATKQLIYNPDPWGPKCSTLCGVYATDLVNLTVPAFAWYWNLTGDSTYLARGDEMFEHALDSDVSYSGKIFSQNYKWSFEYLRWRKATRGAGTCPYSVSPASLSISAAGGPMALQVTTGPVCPWSADSNAGWAAITAGASGTGAGTVAVSVSPNTATTPRTATVTIADKTVTLTQAAAESPCTYAVSTSTVAVPAAGGPVTVGVTAGSGCNWTAASTADWVSVSPAAGTVNLTVSPNTANTSRTATVTIADKTVTLTQAAAPCTYAVSTSTVAIPAAGGPVTIGVTAGSGCNWTAASTADWVSVSPAAGTVNLYVSPNTGATPRTTAVTIADKTVTLTQAAAEAPCTYAVSVSTVAVPASGGPVTVEVTAGPGCKWKTVNVADWVSVSMMPGTVILSVSPNTANTSRTATVTIADHTVTLAQAAAAAEVPCTYAISMSTLSVGAAGGTVAIEVTSGSDCTWTAASSANWAKVAVGPGVVKVTVAANLSTASRTATLTIADKTVAVMQPAVGNAWCTYSVATKAASFASGGGTAELYVNTPPGCMWSAMSYVPWAQVVVSGGHATIAATDNPGNTERTGMVIIAGEQVTVTQSAAPAVPVDDGCTYEVSPNPIRLDKGAGQQTFTLLVRTSSTSCRWAADPGTGWLVVRGPVNYTGTQAVTYRVERNDKGGPRTARLKIAGKNVTVAQN